MQRAKNHKHDPKYANAKNGHCGRWIASLHARGVDFQVTALEVVKDKAVLGATERWWIAYGRASGWPLTNLTDGGEGAAGRVLSESTRHKIGVAQRAHLATPEGRARHIDAHRTSNYRREASERTKRQRVIDPGNMLPGDLNVAKRPDVRAKISASARARGKRPDISGDRSPAKRPEVRAKLRAAAKARELRKRSTRQ